MGDIYAHSNHSEEHSSCELKCDDSGSKDDDMDKLLHAAKVLSNVKQSRQEMEMKFALVETEEQMVDLVELMQSLQNQEKL